MAGELREELLEIVEDSRSLSMQVGEKIDDLEQELNKILDEMKPIDEITADKIADIYEEARVALVKLSDRLY